MELLSVAKARSIWLFDVNDLNPKGKSLEDLLDWLKDSYDFKKAPSAPGDVEEDTKALAFLNGHFQVKEEVFISVDLRLYNDGLVGDTRSSTKDTDAFLEDVLTSATKEFSLVYKPSMVHSRLYVSELNVRCDRSLSTLNPLLRNFSDNLSKVAKLPSRPRFELSGLTFWDGESAMGTTPGAFRFERKLGVPFSQNRYYSAAPMHTEDHLALLEALEQFLGP